MCFVKSSAPQVVETQVSQDIVQRKEADASTTKTSQNNAESKGYNQNIKTSPLGLTDEANVSKKRLLGE